MNIPQRKFLFLRKFPRESRDHGLAAWFCLWFCVAWLLSATLARRQNDMVRARNDIAKALKRAGDDAAVQLEAGNIAVLSGDEAGARAAWTRVTEIAPSGAQASAAKAALAQFDAAAQ